MMNKPVVCETIVEKRKKLDIFGDLHYINDTLDEAVCILEDLKELITQLPDTLEHADLSESALILDASLDKCMKSVAVHFEEIEQKLDELQKSLLHDDTHRFSTMVSEIRCSQKLIDTMIAKAEKEIYGFLESEGRYFKKQRIDIGIKEIVLSI